MAGRRMNRGFTKPPEDKPIMASAAGVSVAEKAAAVGKTSSEARMEELENLAGFDFRPHRIARAGYEYIWEKDGKPYSLHVKAETTLPSEITSAEFYGGNRNFRTQYRGGVCISTNDPRRKDEVQKDPGPQVWCNTPSGKRIVLPIEEFLDLVNKYKARAVSTTVRRL